MNRCRVRRVDKLGVGPSHDEVEPATSPATDRPETGKDQAFDEVPYTIYTHPMVKTTVYLDEDAYARVKLIARRRGLKPAMLIREAVAQYADRHSKGVLPRSLGLGRSGRDDLSERAEELLEGLGAE